MGLETEAIWEYLEKFNKMLMDLYDRINDIEMWVEKIEKESKEEVERGGE